MKTQLLLGIVMLSLGSIGFAADKADTKEGPGDSAIQDQEKAVWDAYKAKDADKFKSYFTSDYQGVYADGFEGIKDELADLKKSEIKSYSLDKVKVVHPTKTSALITYKVDLSGSYDGKDMSGTYNTASLWVKRGDKWLAILHTQAKEPSKK